MAVEYAMSSFQKQSSKDRSNGGEVESYMLKRIGVGRQDGLLSIFLT